MSVGFDIDAAITRCALAIDEAMFVQEHNFRTRGTKAARVDDLRKWMAMLQQMKAAGGGTVGMTTLAQKVPVR